MSAIHQQVLDLMLERLKYKCEIMVCSIPPLNMTHEECLELIAPAEHIDILTKAAKYASTTASAAWMTVEVPGDIDGQTGQQVRLSMLAYGEKTPPLPPRYPQWQPGKSGHKIIAWLNKRYEIGRRFGTAKYVINYLAAKCETSAQVRYMFPSILTLCRAEADPRMAKWVARHAEHRPCKHTPPVPAHIKAAIQDASALLTSSVLIGDDVPAPDWGYVRCMPVNLGGFELGLLGKSIRVERM